MAAVSLPVKYRPKSFDEIVGQQYAVKVLKGYNARNKIPGTIILVGPPGCGKTTSGRLFARLINCNTKNCSKNSLCESCQAFEDGEHPDYHEMNMAIHRKIEDVRSLVSYSEYRANFKYRVFMLDEFHHVPDVSVQPLLKPLEEPSADTVWIVATMHPDKLHEAVKSRGIFIPFAPATTSEITGLIKKVSRKEGYKLGKSVQKWIASLTGNIPRDSISLTDSVIAYMAAEEETIMKQVPEDMANAIVKSGVLGNKPTAIAILALLYVHSPIVFAFLQKDVTSDLISEMYYLQDNFVAHFAYGNKTWRWSLALKTISKQLKTEIKSQPYKIPIGMHIRLSALLGEAMDRTRRSGMDAGVSLRLACSKWWDYQLTAISETE